MSSAVEDKVVVVSGPLNPSSAEEGRKGSSDQSAEDVPTKEESPEITFPEGGLKAWSVAIGCALVLFATFGNVNAFGSVLPIVFVAINLLTST